MAVGTFSAQADEVTNLQFGETKTYIVQLVDDPVVAFDGGHGLTATAPKAGEKVDVDSAAAQAYTDYLGTQRSKTLKSVGLSSADVVTTYEVALNGFAVKMNGAEAAHMLKSPGVVQVWEDEVRYADTVQTPDYLGLTGENGVWTQEFGGYGSAGTGVIVGDIDTGIDPTNPSFSPDGMPVPPTDWGGDCAEAGTDRWGDFECNNKIIGARWYGEEFGNTVIPAEYASARDLNGHGSHTAGTAAGNHGVPLSIMGTNLGLASGMAPMAHIAVYKALWMTADGNGSGTTAGLVGAIDDAVADGVDVINYSISGSSTNIMGADEVAFLYAADAGIFVSTSAGNSGDTVGESSVAHNAPWTMTVAASTHNRGAAKTVTLGNGEIYDGVGVGDGVDGEVVNSEDIPATGSTADAAKLCKLGSVDDTAAAGKIVLCTRGEIARTDKSQEVADSGGIGMILANSTDAESLNADFHFVPSIHVNGTDGDAIKAYVAAEATPTASISEQSTAPVNAPEMAGFSSFGPALAGGGDLLKPDITGPGVDIAAAYAADPETGDYTFNQISGTSMSAPHITGLGALLKQKYPTWSPAAIKSAMMTTARDTDDNGGPIQRSGSDATPLDYGAGEVQPAPSYGPGLVYDAGWDEWLDYACAIGQYGGCEGDVPDPSDLNYPSIAIGDLPGRQTVTRTVTDVTGTGGTYAFDIDAPAGTTVTVSPETLVVPARGTASYEVTITATTAEADMWTFGQLRLVNGDTVVESPIAVRPLELAAPGELEGEGQSGSIDYQVTPGFNGTLSMDIDGLIPSDVLPLAVVSDGPSGGAGIGDSVTPIVVPEGTKTLRVSMFDSEITPSETDMDLYLAGPDGFIVAQSAAGGSNESVTLNDPEAGTYLIAIDYWSGAAGAVAQVPTHVWTVSDIDEGNMTVSPETAAATSGEPIDLTVAWDGLAPASRYLGNVNYLNGSDVVGKTIVSIVTEAGAPVVTRVAGADRYATAAAISELYPDGADTVYIASGYTFADALSGSAAAGAGINPGVMTTPEGDAAPVLLVAKNGLPQVTADALDAIDPSSIIVLGGSAAVSTDIEDELAAWAEVTRIGGADRYETAALLAQEFPAGLSKVYVASGMDSNFPDALAASALAGHEGVPVLLTRTKSVPAVVSDTIDELAPAEIVVVGGSAAVSDGVYTELDADKRLAGEDRWATNVAITAAYEADAAEAFVASGMMWPDALTGAAYAGYQGAPMVLTRPTALPGVIKTELNRLSPADVTIFGGTAAVGQAVEDELNAMLPSWQ